MTRRELLKSGMMLGAAINYLLLAPLRLAAGVIAESGGSALRRISSWSRGSGVPMRVASGLLLFVRQWTSVVRAFGARAAVVQ